MHATCPAHLPLLDSIHCKGCFIIRKHSIYAIAKPACTHAHAHTHTHTHTPQHENAHAAGDMAVNCWWVAHQTSVLDCEVSD